MAAATLTQPITFQITLPVILRKLLNKNKLSEKAKTATEIKTRLILDMVRNSEISSTKGAELLDIRLEEFLNLLAKHNIPYFNYSYEDVRRDLKILKYL